MRFATLRQTCHACPSQWEGQLDDGSMFYARYRHGIGCVEVNGRTIVTWAGLEDGLCEWADVVRALHAAGIAVYLP